MGDESGLALVVTLGAILVMLTVSATLAAVARNEYRLAAVSEASRQALVVAEAGLERGLFEVRRDAQWTDTTGATAMNTGSSWYPLCLAPNGVPPCGGARAVGLPFPAADPIGTVTIELSEATANAAPGCDRASCIRVRATGRVRESVRVVQAVARRVGTSGLEVGDWREVW
jgi:hypothetical protein